MKTKTNTLSKRYESTIRRLAKCYEFRIRGILLRLQDRLTAAGAVVVRRVSSDDMGNDCFRWYFVVARPGTDVTDLDNTIEVSFEICEERQHEGGDGYGINFMVSACEYGGRVLSQLSPYNYTPECWVDSRKSDEVEARFVLSETADDADFGDILKH